jgi:phospholipid/cholesterol/gamma-HCH transport system substrate-binding protein
METRAHYVLIGAFVLSAIALAFLFILWLGQTQREYDPYDVVFAERVSGLSVGAAVLFNGIQKGEVEELRIDPENPSVVIARVRVDKDTPVKTDTRAELELVGFTGLAVIQFVGGTKDKPLLKDVTRGVPQIQADMSGFGAFLAGSGDIVEAAQKLLSEENTKAFSNILLNIDKLTRAMADEDANLRLTVQNSAKITSDLAAASASLKELSDNLNTLASKDAPLIVADARRTLQSTEKLMNEMNALVAENREPIAAFTNQGLAQIGPAVSEARRTMRTLDQVLREIDRDPRGYLFGESTPRYEASEQ